MSDRPVSLRRRLSTLMVLAILLLAMIESVWSFFSARHEVEELFDAELAQTTRLATRILVAQADGSTLDARSLQWAMRPLVGSGVDAGAGHPYEKKLALQVWTPDSGPLLDTPFASPTNQPAQGFSWLDDSGYRWRMFTLSDDVSGLVVQSAQREDVRAELVGDLAMGTILPLFVVLPVLLLSVVAIVYGGFRPLRRLEKGLAVLGPDRLRPQTVSGAPREVAGLVQAINGLLQRLDQALKRERQFSADAAHELRTPLAALRLNLEREQTLSTQASDRLAASVDRMTHLVDQMLLLARVSHRERIDREPLDLCAVVRDSLALMAPIAFERGIEPALVSNTGGATISGNRALLESLLNSLLNNAVAYSPAGSTIEVSLHAVANHWRVRLFDQGPGIPEAERERALAPYVRLDQRRGQGSGLGLAIAVRIMALHGGQLRLLARPDGQTGLCVELMFPRLAGGD